MNPDITAFTESVAAKPPETFYEMARRDYLVNDAKGDWLPLTESQYKRLLKHHGLSAHVEAGERLSPIDTAILDVQQTRNVHFAGPLAGYKRGFHEFDQHRVLVTSSPRIIEPVVGEWTTLAALVKGLLDDGEQLPFFYGWTKIAFEGLRSGVWMPGQALVLCGPHNCGKSLLQQLITVILGGRVARPYQFMNAGTAFNADLFGAEHLAVEDESPSTDMRARRAFGSQLKNVTVCEDQRMHAKNCTPVMLRPFWRLTVSINDEMENIQVLPPIDDSLADKVLLFRARRVEMPMPTGTSAQRRLFWQKLLAELPAFLSFLQTWPIPPELQSQRFGIKEYHHPGILALLDDVAPEFRLLALIDQLFFGKTPFVLPSTNPFELTAEQIQSQLTDSTSPCSFEARRLLSWNNACGTYLGRLAKRRPDRVQQRRTAESRHWLLTAPAAAATTPEASSPERATPPAQPAPLKEAT